MVSKENHPQMALIQVSELLQFAQIYIYIPTQKDPILMDVSSIQLS